MTRPVLLKSLFGMLVVETMARIRRELRVSRKGTSRASRTCTGRRSAEPGRQQHGAERAEADEPGQET